VKNTSHTINKQHEDHGTSKSLIIGFAYSIVLTLAAYFLVVEKVISGWVLDATIVTLCLAQITVQLLFFLHLKNESRPRWKLLIFLFMLGVVVILIAGSLWIMHNLDYRMMTDMSSMKNLQTQ